MKLKSFCKAKDTVSKTKQSLQTWKGSSPDRLTSDRELISEVYKELKKLDTVMVCICSAQEVEQ